MPPSSAGPGPPAEERLGDANARELAQTRLVATACDANHRQVQSLVERQIANMREEVEMSWDAWRMRPECRGPFDLGAYRESGTLGLSGVGEGGGGRGEGVGLGSIGTIGSGSGQGFGSGHGRLGGSHSTTNNQVEGVGEADIVKNDGRYLYLALNGALRIVDAKSPRVISVTKLTSDVRQLLVEGNRAVIFTASGDSKGLANRASHRLGGRCTYGYDCTSPTVPTPAWCAVSNSLGR
jgi:hypothetical protein